MSSPYAELHCLSNFSFLRGASHPDELVEQAKALGYSALALTDECSVSGIVRAHEIAKRLEFKLIIGAEIALVAVKKTGIDLKLVLLATDRDGYGNLCELISHGRSKAVKGKYRLTRDDLVQSVPGCLILWLPEGEDEFEQAAWVKGVFSDRAWIAAQLLAVDDDADRIKRIQVLSKWSGLPVVATGGVHMHTRDQRALQDTLTAIRLKRPLAELGYVLHSNGERHLRSLQTLARLYPAAWLEESVAIAERCGFSLDSLRYEYPEEIVPPEETPKSYLRKLVDKGFVWRFSDISQEQQHNIRALVEKELALIDQLNYEPYFLTIYDIVNYARSRDILCQGRGSAANSVVCYCLGITEVNPARMQMLFERFISAERREPPDIDVDFEHERREEVMQYIYEKYSRQRAALTATVITYRPKSALRDVGKALGMELSQVDLLAKSLAWWDHRDALDKRLREVGFDPGNPVVMRVLSITRQLIGFPRHLSQHTGGFVISRDRLSRLVPIENAAMEKRTVIQWEKSDLESLGLMKVDCLALGMLSAIRRALAMIGDYRGKAIGIKDIPEGDHRVYEMVQKADTIGVFQIESRAQMAMLPRLKPKNFYDLVVQISIVRPGPIQGGMVHPYLRRREGREEISYPSNEVKAVLERTLGVPIFQEQVMQLAVAAAGFSPGEADQLRRSMAAWRRSDRIQQFKDRLVSGMLDRGYTLEYAERLFRQIEGFGEYGFPESHAASFALLAYASAWLKCHEPAAFTCALLNSQPMGFYAPAQLIQDARNHGVEIRPVDVQKSFWDSSLERKEDGEPALRLGFQMIKGIAKAAAQRILDARSNLVFASLSDLAERADLARHDLERLAAGSALQCFASHRRQAYWEVQGIEVLPAVLRGASIAESQLALDAPSEGEDLVADYDTLGFTLGRHPLSLLRDKLARWRAIPAAKLTQSADGEHVKAAGLVINRQRPGTASGVIFLTLEDETGLVNVVVWNDLANKQRRELLGARLLGVSGVLERQGGVLHLIARRLTDHTRLLGRLLTHSRDFH